MKERRKKSTTEHHLQTSKVDKNYERIFMFISHEYKIDFSFTTYIFHFSKRKKKCSAFVLTVFEKKIAPGNTYNIRICMYTEYGILNKKKTSVTNRLFFPLFHFLSGFRCRYIEHRREIPFFQSSHFYSTLLFVICSPVMYSNRHKSPILILIQTPTYGYEMNSFFRMKSSRA